LIDEKAASINTSQKKMKNISNMVLGPITPHGSVVVNASYDYAHFAKATSSNKPDGGNSEYHRIEKKDLVFIDKATSKRKRTSYNEPDLHVFASSNGLDGLTDEEKRKSCSFIGISNAHIDANSHRHAAVTIAGLTTIKNTGPHRIEAGDKIVWDIGGDTAGRKVFRTMPYGKMFGGGNTSHFAAVKKSIEAGDKSTDNKEADMCARMFNGKKGPKFDEMKSFLDCYLEMSKRFDSRVIGTALSKADSGGDFDILVRHTH
jgi:hypothetical protein